jgi:signal transduction histidine kinase
MIYRYRPVLRGMEMHRIRLPVSVSITTMCALVLGLFITALLFLAVRSLEHDKTDIEFQRQANFRIAAVKQGLDDAEQVLRVINQSFVAFGVMSREQFHIITQPMLDRYPYIQKIAFRRAVSAVERPAFEARMRAQYPDFVIKESVNGKIVPVSTKKSYWVVEYVEPIKENEALFGLDTSSISSQTDAMERSLETGKPSATEPFRLIQQNEGKRGVVLLLPVYRNNAGSADIGSRPGVLIGDTAVALRASDLIAKILEPTEMTNGSSIDINVYGNSSLRDDDLVFRRGHAPAAPASSGLAQWLFYDQPAAISQTLWIADKPWHMAVSAQPVWFTKHNSGSPLMLAAGVLLSLLAAAYLQTLASRSQRIQRLVDERTAELKLANKYLSEDIAARKQAEEALKKSQRLLRKLTAHQQQIKENERKRIAREIHDELGQNLLALRIDVSMLHARTAGHPRLNERVDAALNQIDITMKAMRSIINDLRPAVLDLGLHAAIEWQMQEFQRRSGIKCELKIDHEECDLDDYRATALFRILQESLTNVLRHAQASQVQIVLRKNGANFCMNIEDNGHGFVRGNRRKANSFGLVGIKERITALGGAFSINSDPSRGTALMISIPVAVRSGGID